MTSSNVNTIRVVTINHKAFVRKGIYVCGKGIEQKALHFSNRCTIYEVISLVFYAWHHAYVSENLLWNAVVSYLSV